MLFEIPYPLNLVVRLLRVSRLSLFRWDVVDLVSVWFRSQRPLEAAEVVVELMVDQVLRQVFGSTGVLAVCIESSVAERRLSIPIHDNTVLTIWKGFSDESSVVPFCRMVAVLVLDLDRIANVERFQ